MRVIDYDGSSLPPKLSGPGMEPKIFSLPVAHYPAMREKQRAYNALPNSKHPTSKWHSSTFKRKDF